MRERYKDEREHEQKSFESEKNGRKTQQVLEEGSVDVPADENKH